MPDAVFTLPDSIDLAIVGAGPHALTLVTHLLQKKKSMRGRFLVFDPSGTWMRQWNHQFAALEIPHLRSPAVHHPDPNPYALRHFAESRSEELFPPYDLPGTQLFQDFCRDVVGRWELQERVIPAQVQQIEPFYHQRRQRFRLGLADGRVLIARRVVLAIAGGTPQIPVWAQTLPPTYPADRLLYAHQIDLRGLTLAGERVLIVGSGLTSGHLALGAINRGATVMKLNARSPQPLSSTIPGSGRMLGQYDPLHWHTPHAIPAFQGSALPESGAMPPELPSRLWIWEVLAPG